MSQSKKISTVLLILGGASSERPISKRSSKSIYQALLNLGYRVLLLDPAYGELQPPSPEIFFEEADFSPISSENYLRAFELPFVQEADAAFIGLHGRWGEDGTVQSILSLKNIPYTGSGILACALSQQKDIAKIVMSNNGVPVPQGFSFNRGEKNLFEIAELIHATFGYPCIVKPNDEGSTFGLTVLEHEANLSDALKLSFKYAERVLIEEFIPGRELTVGVIEQTVLPVLEIRPKHGLYDFECKYTAGMSEYLVPAPISEELSAALQESTLAAFHALGCRGYARLDFRLKPDGSFFCLECNPLPGFTSTSLVPKMAHVLGLSFEDVVDKILKLAEC